MNYTFQSFNYREGQGTRPFYDLIANIAAEGYGHIELVAAAINTMLTGATPDDPGKRGDAPLKHLKDQAINPHHFLAGGQAALPQDSRGNPWTGDFVFSPDDYREIVAVFKGPHPETGEPLEVVDEAPEGVPPYDLPAQPAVLAPDYAPEESRRSPPSCASRPPCPTSPRPWSQTTPRPRRSRSPSRPARPSRRSAAQ